MKILVTGGAGYIGSHTVLELLTKGHQVSVVDNFSNSSPQSLQRVQQLTGKPVVLHHFDLRDQSKLEAVFASENYDGVIHFAGLKAVGESVSQPLNYYDNNVGSTIALCKVMQKHGVTNLIFSSSATVYGDPAKVPITEDAPVHPSSPYGQTKAMIEQILSDLVTTKTDWRVSILRYFNPVGAHQSGQIGEDPTGPPNNLMPYVARVAVGQLPQLTIFGDNYDTPDGTGVRDYIHVVDLARGHIAALENLPPANAVEIYNLGTGKGYSVLEVVRAFEKASGRKIAYQVAGRRPGDIAVCYADASKAKRQLNWRAERTLDQACRDTWRWQSQNPNGYN